MNELCRVLATFSYHISCIMTNRPYPGNSHQEVRFGLGLGDPRVGPAVLVQVVILPYEQDSDPWGVWAQVFLRGADDEPWRACGNRCGGREEYARLCAPVIAWTASHSD